jgi:hypothetical protein
MEAEGVSGEGVGDKGVFSGVKVVDSEVPWGRVTV